jgi:hypothetical protein
VPAISRDDGCANHERAGVGVSRRRRVGVSSACAFDTALMYLHVEGCLRRYHCDRLNVCPHHLLRGRGRDAYLQELGAAGVSVTKMRCRRPGEV